MGVEYCSEESGAFDGLLVLEDEEEGDGRVGDVVAVGGLEGLERETWVAGACKLWESNKEGQLAR